MVATMTQKTTTQAPRSIGSQSSICGGRFLWSGNSESLGCGVGVDARHVYIGGGLDPLIEELEHAYRVPREIMALVRERRAALATGHLSFAEIAALVEEAAAQGFDKLILTHPYDKAPGLTLEQVRALARPHVRIEFVFCSITPNWRFTDAATIAHCIRTLGVARFVISSDGGQAHNPMPAEGYRRFVHALHAEGIAAEDFRVMCRDNGAFLIDG